MENEKVIMTFILCFLTVIWKRIYVCSIFYSENKKIPLTGNIIMKSLKYNLFSPIGILEKIKPYLERALTIGFLMPNEFKHDPNVSEAIYLFGKAYSIYEKEQDWMQEKNFIIENIADFDYEGEKKQLSEDIIELMDSWDIDIRLIPNKDKYTNLIQNFLFSVIRS